MSFKYLLAGLPFFALTAHADLPLTVSDILADKQYLGETALKLRQKTIDKYNCIYYYIT
ncbi:hypothetical protein [Moraxella nonliquefaciens]|uniref:Uncharacterized protein n=1 Tax=Moraxella nonliquefaciens TaxID=478 RepID=A0A7T3BYR3_MORNO|nr:hypothetical protein [Moraxella nonliquefaciens]QPT44372.1 hypothetical protein I6G26_10010 [Moraxella nonliquefaciens]QQC29392.1 hypothetical protein I6H63_08795 [Moraxella nonliquefaciens]